MQLLSVSLFIVSLLHGSAVAQSLSVSTNGMCGGSTGYTCLGSTYGDCCSGRGFCGSTNDYCNPSGGCQIDFGSCSTNTSLISVDGNCGSTDPNNQVCIGSTWGSCCSGRGYCGNTTDYCGGDCQSAYGTCGGSGLTIDTGTSSVSASSSATSSASSSSATSNNTSSTTSASQSSSSATAASASQQESELQSTKSSLKSTQIGLGIMAALLVIAIIAIGVLLFKRRRKQQTPAAIEVEKGQDEVSPVGSSHTKTGQTDIMSPVSEAPPTPYYQASEFDSKPHTTKVDAHELANTAGRAELGSDYRA